MSARIAGPETKALEADRDVFTNQYQQHIDDLAAIMAETPAIAFEAAQPAIGDKEAKDQIAAIVAHFDATKAGALSEAQGVLGTAFDPEDKEARENLEASIAPAIERLRTAVELPSIARLSALSLTQPELDDIERLLDLMEREGGTLAALAEEPDRARREQFYTPRCRPGCTIINTLMMVHARSVFALWTAQLIP
jgi:hypothetical protein